MHRVRIEQGRHDEQYYASGTGKMFGPFETGPAAAIAINTAAAQVAIDYAGLECTADEALDETFGAGENTDERDRRSHLYYNAALNLMEGAEQSVIEQLLNDNPDIEECMNWTCHVCNNEWTGPDSTCYQCQEPETLTETEQTESDAH